MSITEVNSPNQSHTKIAFRGIFTLQLLFNPNHVIIEFHNVILTSMMLMDYSVNVQYMDEFNVNCAEVSSCDRKAKRVPDQGME